jgi:hypothetical protein
VLTIQEKEEITSAENIKLEEEAIRAKSAIFELEKRATAAEKARIETESAIFELEKRATAAEKARIEAENRA